MVQQQQQEGPARAGHCTHSPDPTAGKRPGNSDRELLTESGIQCLFHPLPASTRVWHLWKIMAKLLSDAYIFHLKIKDILLPKITI